MILLGCFLLWLVVFLFLMNWVPFPDPIYCALWPLLIGAYLVSLALDRVSRWLEGR